MRKFLNTVTKTTIIIIAIAVLVFSGIALRGGFDAIPSGNGKLPLITVDYFPQNSSEPQDETKLPHTETSDNVTQEKISVSFSGTVLGTESNEVFWVSPGEDIAYQPTVPEDCVLEILGDSAEIVDGNIVLKGINSPVLIKYNIRKLKKYSIELINDPALGILSSVGIENGSVIEGNSYSLSALPCDGYRFTGFSSGKPLRGGGELITESSEVKLTPDSDGKIYANYQSLDGFTLIYHPNGGSISAGQTSVVEKSSDAFYLCPNARISNGTFVRPGHMLVGYNTEPDGSGKFYAPGWNVVMPDSKICELYAVWMPETSESDLIFKETAGGYMLSGLTDKAKSAETLVIPASFKGKSVVSVAAGAISSSALKKLYLPDTVRTLNDSAISNCPELCEVHLFDLITTASDNAVSSCPKYQKLYIGAARAPRCTTSLHGAYAIKFERLQTETKPKIIIANGSNTAFGLDSELLIKKLADNGESYTVVNMGFNWKTSVALFIEIATNFIAPGDILLYAPELQPEIWGLNNASDVMWDIFEGCYEVMSMIDVRNYSKIMSTFSYSNKWCESRPAKSYEDHYKYVNFYGDNTEYHAPTPLGDAYVQQKNRDLSVKTYLQSAYVTNMNRAFDAAAAKGAKIYMSFPTTNKNCLSAASLTEEYQTAFTNAVKEKLHVKVISAFSDYIVPPSHCFNNDYHIATAYIADRTEKLAADIIAALKSGN